MSEQVKLDRNAAFAACPDSGCDWSSFYRGWQAAVSASDHATLQAECDRFERELSSLGESLIESMRENAKLRVECERLRDDNGRLIEDRARFPDRPDFIGNMIAARFGNLRAGQAQAEKFAASYRSRMECAESELAAIKAQAAKNVLLAQLEKPSGLVTGTTNWAAYIASSVVSPFSAAAREALKPESQRITPAVNPQLTTAGNDS